MKEEDLEEVNFLIVRRNVINNEQKNAQTAKVLILSYLCDGEIREVLRVDCGAPQYAELSAIAIEELSARRKTVIARLKELGLET